MCRHKRHNRLFGKISRPRLIDTRHRRPIRCVPVHDVGVYTGEGVGVLWSWNSSVRGCSNRCFNVRLARIARHFYERKSRKKIFENTDVRCITIASVKKRTFTVLGILAGTYTKKNSGS